jgi:hypothetical protein
MSSMDFGEVLSKAWRIVWKHKVLWIFGIFAGCSRGGGGGGGGGGSGWQQNLNQGQPFNPGTTSDMERYFSHAGQWIGDHLWVVALVVLAILILAVLAIFLGTIGKIGLIRGTFHADGGAEKLHFGELFRESRPFFWRVFLLSFLIGLAFLVILAPLGVIGVLTAGVGFLCMLPLLCILIPLSWVIGLVVQQADAALVIENLGMLDGVRRGWEVVRKNVGPVLVIGLITAVIGIAIGIVLAIPILVIVVPAVVGFATSRGDFPTVALTLSGLCFVVYLPILVVAQGILTAYIESVWTLTFLRLTRPAEVPGSASALPAHA